MSRGKLCRASWEFAGRSSRLLLPHCGRHDPEPGGLRSSACHSGDDWGGGVGGRGEEGSQCWQGRDCLGCEAPSPSSPASSDPRTDDCSAAGSSSSIAGCCHCPYSPQTSQPYPCPEISKRALGFGSFLIGLRTLELSDLHHQYCPRLAPDP